MIDIPSDLDYDEDIYLTEESVRESTPDYFIVDSFNFKMNKDFMLSLALSNKSSKDISVVYYFINTMKSNNVINNIKHTDIYTKAEIPKSSYYKLLERLKETDLILQVDKNTIMVNPEMVINFRKSIRKDRPQLLALWSEYKRQSRKE